jgi:hypothetical protein
VRCSEADRDGSFLNVATNARTIFLEGAGRRFPMQSGKQPFDQSIAALEWALAATSIVPNRAALPLAPLARLLTTLASLLALLLVACFLAVVQATFALHADAPLTSPLSLIPDLSIAVVRGSSAEALLARPPLASLPRSTVAFSTPAAALSALASGAVGGALLEERAARHALTAGNEGFEGGAASDVAEDWAMLEVVSSAELTGLAATVLVAREPPALRHLLDDALALRLAWRGLARREGAPVGDVGACASGGGDRGMAQGGADGRAAQVRLHPTPTPALWLLGALAGLLFVSGALRIWLAVPEGGAWGIGGDFARRGAGAAAATELSQWLDGKEETQQEQLQEIARLRGEKDAVWGKVLARLRAEAQALSRAQRAGDFSPTATNPPPPGAGPGDGAEAGPAGFRAAIRHKVSAGQPGVLVSAELGYGGKDSLLERPPDSSPLHLFSRSGRAV